MPRRGLLSFVLAAFFMAALLIQTDVPYNNEEVTVNATSVDIELVANPYPWPHNGCTASPSKPGGIDFTPPCNQHDGCYARHWADRATCDRWFYNDMIAACKAAPLWRQVLANCGIVAGTYYSAVRTFGDRFYNSNGEHVRINTPMRFA